MEKPNLEEWTNVMKDGETLKILFYLREFNPSVTVDDLNKNLEIQEEEIKEKLNRLEDLGIVIHTDSTFKLSKEGKNMIEGVYSDLGEPIPPE